MLLLYKKLCQHFSVLFFSADLNKLIWINNDWTWIIIDTMDSAHNF